MHLQFQNGLHLIFLQYEERHKKKVLLYNLNFLKFYLGHHFDFRFVKLLFFYLSNPQVLIKIHIEIVRYNYQNNFHPSCGNLGLKDLLKLKVYH